MGRSDESGRRGKTPMDSAESTAPTLAGAAATAKTPAPLGKDKNIDSHADTAIGEEGETGGGTEPEAEVDEEGLVGDTLRGRYEIVRKVGQGGMGAVYEAKDSNLGGKRVAVKVLLEKYASKDQVVARLQQEARLASSIGHPNIVNITDFGNTVDGRTFAVMEFLEGESLGALLEREGGITPYRALKIARQCASALGAAHKKGIIHRDIKPENIFLETRGDDDFVKVVDFGISKSVRPDAGDSSPRLTQTGMVLGTPLYMSPEQARGDEQPDHRIDVYALGVIMYEMITGDVPFRGTNYLNILTQVVSEEPTPPSQLKPGLNRDLEAVILRAMEKKAEDRYQSMEELDADLAELQDVAAGMISTAARITASRRRSRRRRSSLPKVLVWSGGLVVVGAAVAIALVLMGGDGKNDEPSPEPAAAITHDAGAPAVARGAGLDAGPSEAPVEVERVPIKTSPPGASVYWGDTLVCEPTPCDWQVAKKNEDYTLTAEIRTADGEVKLAGEIRLNPATHEAGKALSVRLKKPPKDVAAPTRRKPAAGGAVTSPTPGDDTDRSGGDLVRPNFKKSPPK